MFDLLATNAAWLTTKKLDATSSRLNVITVELNGKRVDVLSTSDGAFVNGERFQDVNEGYELIRKSLQ